MECHGNLRDQLNTVPSSFIMEEMPIITSSPIEGKLIESSPFTQNNNVNNRDFLTWSALLDDYRRTPKTKTRKKSTVIEQSPSASSSSSSFKTIAEHEMRVLLTPNRKIHVLSSSARKIRPQLHTPKKSNNEKISQSIGVLKEKIRSNEVMTIEEIDAYERILKRHIEQQQKAEEDEYFIDQLGATKLSPVPCRISKTKNNHKNIMNLQELIEDEIGAVDLSPSTSRILKMKNREQEKRLISLAITKRKSSSDIKRKIFQQQSAAQEQIKLREKSEMKQMRASKRREQELMRTTQFSQIHSAHHTKLVNDKRRNLQVSQLQQNMHSQESRTSLQTHKTVNEVWSVFLREQYRELQRQNREQHDEQVKIVNQSAAKLQKLKSR